MILVPSISISNGKLTRVQQGDFSSGKVYENDPLELAKKFEDHGIKRIHLVDLDGAKKGTPKNYHLLEVLAGYTNLKINFSGGVHTDGDLAKVLEYGAESITVATVAVYNKALFSSWLMSYGREKIALGADSLNGLIRVGGWQKETKIDVFDHIDHFHNKGLKYLKTTDISKEGSLSGPSFELYEKIIERFSGLCVYASGGIRNIDDIKRLADIGIFGVVFGKAFYEGRITLKELEQFLVHA
jgi:phosphoribosylformimino-5-aminoimidazole carboxamide ribotide isomerase